MLDSLLQDIQGIITLEDILEQLLQEDIVDETDVLVDVRKATRVVRAKLARTNSEIGRRESMQVSFISRESGY